VGPQAQIMQTVSSSWLWLVVVSGVLLWYGGLRR
jgi:hypothetical protein